MFDTGIYSERESKDGYVITEDVSFMFAISASLLVWFSAVAVIARYSLQYHTHKLTLVPYYLQVSMLTLFSILYLLLHPTSKS